MAYLNLKGNGLLTGVTITAGMGFIVFGIIHVANPYGCLF
jgi:hypothetical protein